MTTTDVLESHLGQSATVPDFHGHSGNDATIAVISFSETIRNHKETKQGSQDCAGPWPYL
jgi:hypothetical protein